jgi:hypothetical protein
MDWRCNSSGTGIALQVQSPEFEPESYQKKKKKKERKCEQPCSQKQENFY